MEVLTNNHFEKILDLFDGVKHNIKIISPFISESMTGPVSRFSTK